MPFHTFLSVWLSTYTGGLDFWKVWKDGLTALVAILCIVTVLVYGKASKLYKSLISLVFIYGFIHLLLIFTTNQPLNTGFLAVDYNLRIFGYLIIGYSLALLLPKANLFSKYSKILVMLSTIVCFLAVLQILLPKDILTHFGYEISRGVKPNFFIDDKPDLFRAFSTLKDPNSLGAFLILPIVLLVQKLNINWQTPKRTMLGGLLILHVWVLLLTFSRSTLLATIIGLITLLILSNQKFVTQNKRKITWSVAILCAVTIGLFSVFRDQYVVQNVVFHADESTRLQTPNELRRDLAKRAVEDIIDQPLGHGPGTAGLVSIRLPAGGHLTENYFLQILYEVGVFGFLIFTTILYLLVRGLWNQRKNNTVKVMLASFAGLVFANLLFHTWSNEAVSIAWFTLAGLSFSDNFKYTGIINNHKR